MLFTPLFVCFGIFNVAIHYSTYVACTNDSYNKLNKEKLIAGVIRMCPSANICTKERTKQGLHSCCAECSCDELCHENSNCCFPPYNNVREFQTCIYPSSEKRLSFLPDHMYFMTTKCPLNVLHIKPEYKDCGNTRVAFWGSLYPIYSSTKKQIYKNSVCAECNGVSDGVLWGVVFANSCPSFPTSLSSTCYVWFHFQQNFELIRSERCGVTCNRTDFNIPPQLDTIMSKKDILDACHSELADFFSQAGYVYKNIFCAICDDDDDNFITRTGECLLPGLFSPSIPKFSWVINEQYIDSFTLGGNPRVTHPVVCQSDANQTIEKCQKLHCPYGQFYNRGLQCLHLVYTVDVDGYEIGLRLHLKQPMTTFDIKNRTDLRKWLTSPWPKRWRVQHVFYDQGVQFAHLKETPSVIVIMIMTRTMEHKRVMDEVEKYLSRTWQINVGNVTLTTHAQFLEYNIIRKMVNVNGTVNAKNIPDWCEIAMHKPPTTLFKPPRIDQLTLTRMNEVKTVNSGKHFMVNKLYYCPTILVNVSTNIWVDKLSFPYNSYTYNYIEYNGRAFFSAEIALIENEQAVICLEDSPYRYGIQSSSNRQHTVSIYMVFAIIVLVHRV